MNSIRNAVKKILLPFLENVRVNILPRKSYGEILLQEARFIGELIGNLKSDGPIVEIGTHFGFSAQLFPLYKETDRP
jgi:hypothetical protein